MEKTEKLVFKILKFIGVILLFFIVPLAFQLIFRLVVFDTPHITRTQAIYLAVASNLLLLLILFFIYRKDLRKELNIFKDNIGKCMDCGLKYWLLGIAGMIISNIFIQLVFNNDQAMNEQAVQEMIQHSPWIMLISAGLLAPILEEICFRKTFYDLIKNKWVFILSSGLFFGILHVVFIPNISMSELLFIIPYGSLGIAFAVMYYKTKSIYTPIIMHIIHNTFLVLLAIFLSG